MTGERYNDSVSMKLAALAGVAALGLSGCGVVHKADQEPEPANPSPSAQNSEPPKDTQTDTPDPKESKSSENDVDYEAEVTRVNDKLRTVRLNSSAMDDLSTYIFAPIKSGGKKPASSIEALDAVLDLQPDFSRKNKTITETMKEDAADRAAKILMQTLPSGEQGAILKDVSGELSLENDVPYLPGGLVTVEQTDAYPFFQVAVTSRPDDIQEYDAEAHTLLANSGALRSTDELVSSSTVSGGKLRYILAPVVPDAPAPEQAPEIPKAISSVATDKHELALTFDADMTPGMLQELKDGKATTWYNKAVIDTLRANNIHATIFLSGLWAQTYPKVAKSLAEDPLFEIGNHSEKHFAFTDDCWNLPTVPDNKTEDDIAKAQQAIEDATGETPELFRFPGLCHDQQDLQVADKLGLTVIDGASAWDTAGGGSAADIANNVVDAAGNGKIFVMHLHGDGGFDKGGAPNTAGALKRLLPRLKEAGYRLVTITQLRQDGRP